MIKVLLTCCSQKTALISSLIDDINESELSIKLILSDVQPYPLARYLCDDFWQMPSFCLSNKMQIIDGLVRHSINIIIPTSDLELSFWSSIRDDLVARNIFVMVSPLDSIICCNDKFNFYTKCLSWGMNPIPTFLDPMSCSFSKIIAKPRQGSGSKNISIMSLLESKKFYKNHPNTYIYQPFIEGTEYTCDVYIDPNDPLRKLCISRKREKICNGEAQISVIDPNDYMINASLKLSQLMHLVGHVNIQFIQDHVGNTFLLECNPRIGGASTLSFMSGMKSIIWFSEASIYKSTPVFPSNIPMLRQVRVSSDLYFKSSDQDF